ncbi:hypothetical protein [Roseateles sp.]|uniref:hypothetical protein n=1 Tax=Roseateles sp. TaxID=1971397 RepID=UPI0025D91A41|nr:hypothetical protein [Roseateles sp.]
MLNWGSRSKRAETGLAGEDAAPACPQRAGLRLLERNYRVAAGSGRHEGKVDLIPVNHDGTPAIAAARTDAPRWRPAASMSWP